jgi:hypothetical protein
MFTFTFMFMLILILLLLLMLDSRLPPAPAFCDESFLGFLIFQFFHTIVIWVPWRLQPAGFVLKFRTRRTLSAELRMQTVPNGRQPVTSNRVALAPPTIKIALSILGILGGIFLVAMTVINQKEHPTNHGIANILIFPGDSFYSV